MAPAVSSNTRTVAATGYHSPSTETAAMPTAARIRLAPGRTTIWFPRCLSTKHRGVVPLGVQCTRSASALRDGRFVEASRGARHLQAKASATVGDGNWLRDAGFAEGAGGEK